MKKTFWSLAALMLMAAPVMTSCSNDLEEIVPAEEAKSNIITITIAPPVAEPETRLGMTGNAVTGWDNGDVVTLYKMGDTGNGVDILNGSGVEFTCINASAGTFSGDLGTDDLADYTLAVYGATAESCCIESYYYVFLFAKNICSEALKNVVVMAAKKDSEGTFTMQIVNNVLKLTNNKTSDIENVAWWGHYNTSDNKFFTPSTYYNEWGECWEGLDLYSYPDNYCNTNAQTFTIKASKTSYINMGNAGSSNDWYGLAAKNGSDVVEVMQPQSWTGERVFATGKIYTKTIE